MFKKLKFPLRIQFLVIALSLAVTTTVLGLSAFLTDTDIYQGTFRTALGDELGFKLTGDAHEDEAILPGGTVDLNVCAEIDKPNVTLPLLPTSSRRATSCLWRTGR